MFYFLFTSQLYCDKMYYESLLTTKSFMQIKDLVELMQSKEYLVASEEEQINMLTFHLKAVRRHAFSECERLAEKIASHPRHGPQTIGAARVAEEINRVKRFLT